MSEKNQLDNNASSQLNTLWGLIPLIIAVCVLLLTSSYWRVPSYPLVDAPRALLLNVELCNILTWMQVILCIKIAFVAVRCPLQNAGRPVESDISAVFLNIVQTLCCKFGVYWRSFNNMKFSWKIHHMMFKRKGGRGGQRLFEQCSKKLHFSYGTASLRGIYI